MVKKHAASVLNNLGKGIDNLGDFDKISAIFIVLGEDHIGRGVSQEHYDIVEEGLYRTIKQMDGPHWDETVKAAWKIAYRVVTQKM